MGIRFRKSFKVAPGVRFNLSRSGVSTSLGKKGATVNIGKKQATTTVGVPGTGLSFTSSTKCSGSSVFKWSIALLISVLLIGWLIG